MQRQPQPQPQQQQQQQQQAAAAASSSSSSSKQQQQQQAAAAAAASSSSSKQAAGCIYMHIASYVASYPLHDMARAIKRYSCSLRAANAFLAAISLHAGEILKCRTSISISAPDFQLPLRFLNCRCRLLISASGFSIANVGF